MMRLVVRTPNWLGDIVMALPVFAALREQYPEEVLVAATPGSYAPLLSLVPGVNEVLSLPTGGGAQLRALRQGRFDAALLLTNSFGTAWTIRRAGIPERWGFSGQWRRPLLTRALTPPPRRPPLHHVARYLELVRGLGIEARVTEPGGVASAEMIQRARRLLDQMGGDSRRPIVGIAPGAAYGHAKRWLPDRYARVMTRVCHEFDACVVLLGSSHDRDAGHAIECTLAATAEASNVVNLIGRTDLSLLVGLLAVSSAVISSDSGPMHLAAALGIPGTALFGPTDERLTSPVGRHDVLTHQVRCRPCFCRDCPIDHRCMTGISEDTVFESVVAHLTASQSEPGETELS